MFQLYPLHLEKQPLRICAAGNEQSLPGIGLDTIRRESGKNRGDVPLTLELSKQFDHDSEFGCSPPKRAAQDMDLLTSKGIDTIKSYLDTCDSSPAKCAVLRDFGGLDLVNSDESEQTLTISTSSSSSKRRILREVDGRLQYVGFPADLKQPECKRAPRPLRTRGGATSISDFFLSLLFEGLDLKELKLQ
jgi:hypothetical protein